MSNNQMMDSGLGKHEICSYSDCTGCAACSSACFQNAISMKIDTNGFWRPVVDMALCVGCNSCNRICPVNHEPETYGPTFAFAYQNSDAIRLNSTSGGFFNAIASRVIDNGGVVCGAAFDDDMVLHHIFVEEKSQLDPLQRSKYVQSSMEGVYDRVKKYLKAERRVLFAGVGCQVAGVRKCFGDNDNLLLLDLVCYGVPSSGLFKDWIQYLGQKYGRVTDVRFRDKSYGYASPNVKVVFDNGKHIESCRDASMYTNLFFKHLSIRDSCFKCHFKTVDRASDITLGDLWTIGKYNPPKNDNKGTTVAFAHTPKGKRFCLELGCMELETQKIISSDARKMVECVTPFGGRDEFWEEYQEDGFESLVKTYSPNDAKNAVKYFVKRLMNKSGISEMYYKRKQDVNSRSL